MKMKKFLFSILILYASSGYSQQITSKSNILSNFTAVIKKAEVNLNWSIYNPVNLYKFRIEIKKSGEELYKNLSEIQFSNFRKKEISDSLTLYSYLYTDKPEENGVYFYRLSVLDVNNSIIASEDLKVGITEVPEFKLYQNNPNPFNPSTIINYKILVPTNVKLMVYSLTGKFVDMLVDDYLSTGEYTAEFNTSKYSNLSSGIYFYKLETNYSSDIKKMIFTK